MELLSENEINYIVKKDGLTKVLGWRLEEFEDKMMGNRADHLKLIIETENDGNKSKLQLFVKCMPRYDKWKFKYLQELRFFYKEYCMLSKLFQEFHNGEGNEKWRPKLYHIREDLFVFEDVSKLGYKMPNFKDTMTFDYLEATVKALARFHAQSFIYEEMKSIEIRKPYSIWDEFSEYVQEPQQTKNWRDTGRNAVMDYLKEFSKYKSNTNFAKKLDDVIPKLYEKSMEEMKPSKKYRNAVVHRDLWSNNIFIKDNGNSDLHVLLVDFQTVIYSSPMLDLSSVIYFNTLKSFRDTYTKELIEIYHCTLSKILEQANVNIDTVLPKDIVIEAYNDSLIFGMTQASLIVPLIAMSNKRKEEFFFDPNRSGKLMVVSRSQEFIEIANEDPIYKNRVSELFDELVERFVLTENIE